jgi:hypothetical protein
MQKTRLEAIGPDGHPLDLVLRSNDHIEIIPPRDAAETAPRIYSAYAVPLDGGYDVTACANDADGIARVRFVDRDGLEHDMTTDGRGPWFFSCNLQEGYEFLGSGAERVVVTSVNDSVAEAAVDVDIVHTVISRPPFVAGLVYDEGNRLLRVTAEPGSELPQDAIDYEDEWPRVYHPDFGYIRMLRTIYWFEEPNVYECVLPFHPQDAPGQPMRVVAGSIGGQYTVVEVRNPETISPFAHGDLNIECVTTYPVYVSGQSVPYIGFDLPIVRSPLCVYSYASRLFTFGGGASFFRRDGGWPADELAPFEGALGDPDVYLRSVQNVNHASVHRLGFPSQWGGVKVTVTGKSPDVFFHELTKQEVIDDWSDKFQPGVTDDSHPYPGDVYVFRTTGGRYGKLLVKNTYFAIHERLYFIWPQLTAFRVTGQFVIFGQ